MQAKHSSVEHSIAKCSRAGTAKHGQPMPSQAMQAELSLEVQGTAKPGRAGVAKHGEARTG